MFLSTTDMIAMMIAMTIVGFMLVMLFLANHTLLTQNRYLKKALRDKQKECWTHHAEVPF